MNFVYLLFFAAAWVGIECYIGGTRLLYSLPAYGVIAIGAMLTLFSIRSKRTPPSALCLGSTLLMGGWVLGRAIYSPVPSLAWPDFYMMVACLMVYLMSAFFLSSIRDQTIMLGVMWAVSAAEVWVALIQFIKDKGFMLFGLLRHAGERPSGMYISPNNFAGLLAAVAIISISTAVWSRWPSWARVLSIYFAVCCLFGVAISGSRGGYFDTIGSLLLFAYGSIYAVRVADPRRFLPALIGTLVGVVAVVALAAFLMSHSAMLAGRMQTMVYRDVRIYNWEAAIDHIHVSPWVGTGSGTHLIYGRLFRRPQIQADPVHAHCDYLELLAEYGIVGGVCMALFLTAHVWKGLRSYSETLRNRLIPSGLNQSNAFAFQLGALCAVGGLAIHSVVDFDMHIPGNALLFAFIFGFLANPQEERQLNFVDRRVTPLAKLIAPALGVLMLWRGLPLVPSEYFAELSREALRDHQFLTSIRYAQKAIGPGSASLITPGVVPSSPSETGGLTLMDRLLSIAGPNPNNPDAYFYLAESNRGLAVGMPNRYLKKHYFMRSFPAYEAGLKVFPQDESMLTRYGQALDGAGLFPQAEVIYQEAIKLDPRSSVVQEFYESHLAAEGKKEEADQRAQERQQAMPAAVDADQKGSTQLQ